MSKNAAVQAIEDECNELRARNDKLTKEIAEIKEHLRIEIEFRRIMSMHQSLLRVERFKVAMKWADYVKSETFSEKMKYAYNSNQPMEVDCGSPFDVHPLVCVLKAFGLECITEKDAHVVRIPAVYVKVWINRHIFRIGIPE